MSISTDIRHHSRLTQDACSTKIEFYCVWGGQVRNRLSGLFHNTSSLLWGGQEFSPVKGLLTMVQASHLKLRLAPASFWACSTKKIFLMGWSVLSCNNWKTAIKARKAKLSQRASPLFRKLSIALR